MSLIKSYLLRWGRPTSTLRLSPALLAVSILSTGILLGLKSIGSLQLLELAAFDQLVRLQPDQEPDSRLLIVGIAESDIKQQKRWPFSDEALAQLLAKLQTYQPKLIGLDLYRDIPHPPGHTALLEQVKAPNVVVITKLDDGDIDGVDALPTVPPERIGFNDVVVDPDGVLRRNFMYAYVGEEKFYSFTLQLSLKYLAEQGIALEVQPAALKLGQAIFPRLEPDSGGYHDIDVAGYQVLLSYRSAQNVARQVTFTDVMEGKLEPSWVKDKIVLIGSTAPSIKDMFLTPYSPVQSKQLNMPGVHVHAHLLSQILGAVLDGESLFWFWPEWGEILWIWVWAFGGGVIAWRLQHPLLLATAGGIGWISLSIICWGVFTQSGWIPLVPPAIAFLLTAGCVLAYKLLYTSMHDPLTGLPNRALLLEQLKPAIAHRRSQPELPQRPEESFALLFLGLDGFKGVNDGLGHRQADQLLIAVAHRLKRHLPLSSTLARIGGDEFGILLKDMTDLEQVTQIADRLQQEIAKPFVLGQQEVFISASAGIVLNQADLDYQPEDFLRAAHTAMDRAKDLGKARHEVFATGMRSHAHERLQLEMDLHRAVAGILSAHENPEFLLNYQPIVSLETRKLVGFETLVRWRHPQQGFISPAHFIPIAEATGLIIPLGKWIFQAACRQMQLWQTQFPDCPIVVSVNLSGCQLSQPDLIEFVEQTLQSNQLEGCKLKLEITESVVMKDVDAAINLFLRLKASNIQLSIDDFGTGYSSLSYLHQFSVNTLKVDRSFVSHMSDAGENTAILQAIIALGHQLGMDIVAEGVETAAQAAALQSLGCEYAQGYFFAKPLDSETATGWLRLTER